MTLRAQLTLVFLLLAILPLAGIVLYSYHASLEAVRRAEQAEATGLAQEMEGRMGQVRSDLSTRLAALGGLPLSDLETADVAEPGELARRLAIAMGDRADLVQQLRIRPSTSPGPSARAGAGATVPSTPATPGVAPVAPSLPTPPSPPAVVIDVDRVLADMRRAGVPLDAAGEAAMKARLEEAERIVASVAGVVGGVAEEPAPPPPPAPAPRSTPPAPTEEPPAPPRTGRLEVPLLEDGSLVGTVEATIKEGEILRELLAGGRQRAGEIPFALDAEGELIALDPDDRSTLLAFDPPVGELGPGASRVIGDGWVVVTSDEDPGTGLVFGVARPLRSSLEELRRTAATNFAWGLAMVGLALFGVLPLSSRLTRGLRQLTNGAERIAAGDLMTRVPIESRNELGQLANAFNRMARDLSSHQERLLQEERRRQEQEMRHRLLERDVARKTEELEEARRFQLSLLPRSLPEHPRLEVATRMRTATEVGGDYYDFLSGPDGALTVAVGDATGHGARAGTMVTVVKSLFSAQGGEGAPGAFLASAAATIRRMELGRMFMAFVLARLYPDRMLLSSAGMPPVLHWRAADGAVRELGSPGPPLGSLEPNYRDHEVPLTAGDVLLFLSDGFPELLDREGHPLGYERVRELFATSAASGPAPLIAALMKAAESHAGGSAFHDDVTFVAVRVRPSA